MDAEDILTQQHGSRAQRKHRNPFPGLRPFNFDEGHLFFGREDHSDEVLRRLAKNKFVAVMGASGTGKSSLIYCGLIPMLYGGYMTKAGSNWVVIASKPGSDPIGNLAESLVNQIPPDSFEVSMNKEIQKSIISSLLLSSSQGLRMVIKQFFLKGLNFFILIDQFEELFRYKREEEHLGGNNGSFSYVNLIKDVVQQDDVPIYVTLTMRSEFTGDCAQFPEFTKIINRSNYLIPQLTRNQAQQVIEGPVAVGGAQITSRLTQQLLNDVGGNQEQLPILQHALMRTWDYWRENSKGKQPLDLIHYESVGTIHEALSQHANEAYDELDENQKRICEIIFKTITEKSTENVGIRRPTPLNVIAAIAEEPEEAIKEVVEVFRKPGRSLLMPSGKVDLTSDSMIDLSHESLMRIWTRLRYWVEEETEAEEMYLRLSEAAANYQIGKSGLWRSPDLQLALNWQQKHKPTLEWAKRYNPAFERTMLFLESSNDAYVTDQKNKEIIQKRMLQRAKILALILGVAAIISALFLVYGQIQKGEANKQRDNALTEKRRAEASELETKEALEQVQKEKAQAEKAKEAESLAREEADAERIKAILNAQEAERQTNIAKQQTIFANNSLLLANEKTKLAEDAQAEESKQRQIAETNEQEAEKLRFLQIARSLAIKSLQEPDFEAKGLFAQHAYLFNNRYGGNSHDKDIYNGLYEALKSYEGESINQMKGHNGSVKSMVYAPDGKSLFSTGADGNILHWDMKTDPASHRVLATEVADPLLNRTLRLSADGRFLLSSNDASEAIQIFDLTQAQPTPKVLTNQETKVLDAVFLRDNSGFLSVGLDSTLRLSDFDNFVVLQKNDARVTALAIRPQNDLVAGAKENGELVVWNVKRGYEETVLFKNPEFPNVPIRSVAFSNDGKWLAFGDEDGIVRVWSVANNGLYASLAGFHSRVSTLQFSPDNTRLAAASLDKAVRVWNLNQLNLEPLVFADHSDWVWTLAFSPDGKQLMTGSQDKVVKRWFVNPEDLAAQMCDQVQRNMTEKEWQQNVGADVPYEFTCDEMPAGRKEGEE